MNLVTPKAGAKDELWFNKPASGQRCGLVEHLSLTHGGQQSVTQYITMMIMILVTSKTGAKHELEFV